MAEDEGAFQIFSGVSWPSGWSTEGGLFVTAIVLTFDHPSTIGERYWAQISRYDGGDGTHSVLWTKASPLNTDASADTAGMFTRGICRINDFIYVVVYEGDVWTGSQVNYSCYIQKLNTSGTELAKYTFATNVSMSSTTEVPYSLAWCSEHDGTSVVNFLSCTTIQANQASGNVQAVYFFDEDLATYTPASGLGATWTANKQPFFPTTNHSGVTAYNKAAEGNGVRYFYRDTSGWRAVQGTSGFTEKNEVSGDNTPIVARGSGAPDYLFSVNAGGGKGFVWNLTTLDPIYTDETMTTQLEWGSNSSPAASSASVLVTGTETAAIFYVKNTDGSAQRRNDDTLAWSNTLTAFNGGLLQGPHRATQVVPPSA